MPARPPSVWRTVSAAIRTGPPASSRGPSKEQIYSSIILRDWPTPRGAKMRLDDTQRGLLFDVLGVPLPLRDGTRPRPGGRQWAGVGRPHRAGNCPPPGQPDQYARPARPGRSAPGDEISITPISINTEDSFAATKPGRRSGWSGRRMPGINSAREWPPPRSSTRGRASPSIPTRTTRRLGNVPPPPHPHLHLRLRHPHAEAAEEAPSTADLNLPPFPEWVLG